MNTDTITRGSVLFFLTHCAHTHTKKILLLIFYWQLTFLNRALSPSTVGYGSETLFPLLPDQKKKNRKKLLRLIILFKLIEFSSEILLMDYLLLLNKKTSLKLISVVISSVIHLLVYFFPYICYTATCSTVSLTPHQSHYPVRCFPIYSTLSCMYQSV